MLLDSDPSVVQLGFIQGSGLMHKQNRHPFSQCDLWSDLGPSFIPFKKNEVSLINTVMLVLDAQYSDPIFL